MLLVFFVGIQFCTEFLYFAYQEFKYRGKREDEMSESMKRGTRCARCIEYDDQIFILLRVKEKGNTGR